MLVDLWQASQVVEFGNRKRSHSRACEGHLWKGNLRMAAREVHVAEDSSTGRESRLQRSW